MASNETSATLTRLAFGSLALGLVVLALKTWAAHLTGSLALYADALESVVNVVTAGVALIAVRLAARPADAALPYGYGKAEYFSAVVIGVFIAGAAIVIFTHAWEGWGAPAPPAIEGWALTGSLAASALNGAWAIALRRAGRRLVSPALRADGQHLLTDVASSVVVVAGVVLATTTGLAWLDPLLAALVGIGILWSGWHMVRHNVVGLMDVAVEPERLKLIRETIQANAEGALEAHDIRTRQAGRTIFIEFHLVVEGAMSVATAHAICDRIEAKLRESLSDAEIIIHVEPEEKAKHSGIVVV